MTKVEIQQHASDTGTANKEAKVAAILKQMATVLRNMRTYQWNNPVLQKSFDFLLEHITTYLKQNESLTLLVRENDGPSQADERSSRIRSDPPTSSISTRLLPSAERRLASTHPAIPPPAMM